MEKPQLDIDFERAANLMDVVQKVATVAPQYTALSGVAMMELKEYNETAQDYLNKIAQLRLAEEQDATAAREQERLAAESKPVKPFTPVTPDPLDPSEPVARRI